MQRALGRVGPGGDKQGKSCRASFQSHLYPLQATQWPEVAFSLPGDESGGGNFSAEVKVLRADCR